MAKVCPSCGYSDLGPFTDNCPICAEPVRNVRSRSGGSGGSNTPMILRWAIGGVVVVMLGMWGCCSFGPLLFLKQFGDPKKAMEEAKAALEADRRTRTVVVPAAQLVKEFQEDPDAADKKYQRKYLEVTGAVVERCGKQHEVIPFIVLHAGDEQAKVKIECFIEQWFEEDEERKQEVENLPAGRTITVRGEYSGRISNIQLRAGTLVK